MKSTIRQVLFFFLNLIISRLGTYLSFCFQCYRVQPERQSQLFGRFIFFTIVIYTVIWLLSSFSHQHLLMVFHWSLIDLKSPRISRTLLSMLANLNYAVWMVSTRLLISKSSSFYINPVPRAQSSIIIIIHSLEFFTSSLADGFSLESEWQQVSSSLQDSS